MTEMKSIAGDGLPKDILTVAEQHLERSADDLNWVINQIKAGDTSRAKEVSGIVTMLGKALQSALDERVRVEKLRRQDAGIVADYALDFDAARDEIGRRLARLRAAGGGGGVS